MFSLYQAFLEIFVKLAKKSHLNSQSFIHIINRYISLLNTKQIFRLNFTLMVRQQKFCDCWSAIRKKQQSQLKIFLIHLYYRFYIMFENQCDKQNISKKVF